MEQRLTNVINFGIGCAQAFSEKYKDMSESIRNGVSDLISEGENSRNDVSLKIREMVQRATSIFSRGDKTQKADVG